MRISVGLNQIESATSTSEIKGLSIAIRQEVQTMMMWASKLTQESINCLDVNVNGRKILFPRFLYELKQKSDEIVNKGGYSII
jgi:hypothetical protein